MPKRYRNSDSGTSYTRKRYKTSTGAVPRRLRGYVRTGGLYGRYAGQLQQLRRRRYGNPKPELKWFDTLQNTPQPILQAGSLWFNSVNLVPEGVAPNNMIGRKIIVRRITVRGVIEKAVSTGASVGAVEPVDYIRFQLIMDRQANGQAPTIADIYTQANTRGFLNLANSKRFKVLKSWEMNLNAQNTVYWNTTTSAPLFQSGNVIRGFDWTKRCYIPIEFNANPATTRPLTDVKSNNIFVVGMSTGPDNNAAYMISVRIRYEDS